MGSASALPSLWQLLPHGGARAAALVSEVEKAPDTAERPNPIDEPVSRQAWRPFGPHVRGEDVVVQLRWHVQNDVLMWSFLLLVLLAAAIRHLLLTASSQHQSGLQSLGSALCWLSVSGAAVLLKRVIWGMHRRSRALAHLPGPKPKNWFMGYMEMAYSQQPHRLNTALSERFGPIWKFRILCFHVVCINDPVLATHIFHSKDFDKIRFHYSFLDPFLGAPTLLTGHANEHWRAVRKGVAPAFSASNMRLAFSHVAERCKALMQYIEQQGPEAVLDVDELLLRESMDVMGLFGFNMDMHAISSLHEPGSEDNLNVHSLLDSTTEVCDRGRLYARWWRLWRGDVRAGWAAFARFKALCRRILQHMRDTKPHSGSFADLLLNTKDPKTGLPMSDAKLLPEIATLLFAGVDTTGHTGTFCLYEISQHPEVEAKIVAELQRLGLAASAEQPHPRELTFSDLCELTYLQAVIKETLRKYPPVAIGTARVCMNKDIIIGGQLHLPAGICVNLSHHSLQNTSYIWDLPQKFLPERWLTPGAEYVDGEKLLLPKQWYQDTEMNSNVVPEDDTFPGDAKRAKRYFPFAEGARNCVGQSLGKLSLTATLASLLSRFSFQLADKMGGAEGVSKVERFTLVLSINGGMAMHALPRPRLGALQPKDSSTMSS